MIHELISTAAAFGGLCIGALSTEGSVYIVKTSTNSYLHTCEDVVTNGSV